MLLCVPLTVIFTRVARESAKKNGCGPLINKVGHTVRRETTLIEIYCGFLQFLLINSEIWSQKSFTVHHLPLVCPSTLYR